MASSAMKASGVPVRRAGTLAIRRPSLPIAVLSGAAVFQLYVPVAGSVHLTAWLLLAAFYPAVSLVSGLPPKRSLLTPAFCGLAIIVLSFLLVTLVSSDRALGVKMIVWTVAGMIAYVIGFHIGAAGKADSLLSALVVWITPVALLNVVFFFAGTLEEAFMSSSLARVLIEPDTLEYLFRTRFGFNALHPLKAGTLFVNANVASIFFGMGLCISLFLWTRRRSLMSLTLVILMFLAFLATGSRAGLMAAVASTAVVLFVLAFRVGARRLMVAIAIASLGLALILILPYSRFAVERIASISQNLDPRWLLWYHALETVYNHPFTGVGFGGWQESFPAFARTFGLDPSLPPHNAFLIAWLWGGLAGLVGMLVLFAGSLYLLLRQSRNQQVLDLTLLGSAILVWVGVQLQFTNFALAEPRIGSVFLLCLGSVLGGLLRWRTYSGKARSGRQEPYTPRVRGMAVSSPKVTDPV